jgi:hypothetical protein
MALFQHIRPLARPAQSIRLSRSTERRSKFRCRPSFRRRGFGCRFLAGSKVQGALIRLRRRCGSLIRNRAVSEDAGCHGVQLVR